MKDTKEKKLTEGSQPKETKLRRSERIQQRKIREIEELFPRRSASESNTTRIKFDAELSKISEEENTQVKTVTDALRSLHIDDDDTELFNRIERLNNKEGYTTQDLIHNNTELGEEIHNHSQQINTLHSPNVTPLNSQSFNEYLEQLREETKTVIVDMGDSSFSPKPFSGHPDEDAEAWLVDLQNCKCKIKDKKKF